MKTVNIRVTKVIKKVAKVKEPVPTTCSMLIIAKIVKIAKKAR